MSKQWYGCQCLQHCLFLSACVVFLHVQTMVWLPVFGIMNVHTDVDACDCTRGLHEHSKRVFTGSWLWGKNPLLHRGLEPVSALRLAFQSGTLPTELFPLFLLVFLFHKTLCHYLDVCALSCVTLIVQSVHICMCLSASVSIVWCSFILCR